jgi:hypothetical protein
MSIRLIHLIVLLYFSSFLYGQSYDEAQKKKLIGLQEIAQKEYEQAQQRIIAFKDTRKSAIPVPKGDTEHSTTELIDIREDGTFIFNTTTNLDASQTIRTNTVYPGGSLNLNLTGTGETLAIWDGGGVREDHELLSGRITIADVSRPK